MMFNLVTKQLAHSQEKLLKRFSSDEQFAFTMAKHPIHAKLYEWLDPFQAKKVLELGCGPGKYVAMLSSLGFKVVGVDPFYFPSWSFIQDHCNADLRSEIYAESLPFEDQAFDHAVCLGALLYFDSPRKALAELHRVTKPGGRLVLRTVNKNNFYTRFTGRKLDSSSNHLFSMSELIKLVNDSGFYVNHYFSYGFWPPILTDLWWYLICVWLPLSLQDKLSNMTQPEHRVNNIIFATRM